MSIRPAISTSKATPTMEGAGVHLHRAFGFNAPETHDPFLLFDDFQVGTFPKGFFEGEFWWPHRKFVCTIVSKSAKVGIRKMNR